MAAPPAIRRGPMAAGLICALLVASNARAQEPSIHGANDDVRDNGFLIEEAFNQETGEIQHILNWVYQWDRTGGSRSREFLLAYTMDVPLGSQKHEFSFTVPVVGGYERSTSSTIREAGVGDTMINYRYQLLADDDFLWCTPRATVIVPTGDAGARRGVGEVGYEFFLPVSRYGKRFDWHFNVGYTMFPSLPGLVPPNLIELENSLQGLTVGGTLLWKPLHNLQPFVEAVTYRNVGHDGPTGLRRDINQMLINPGVRYAPIRTKRCEVVVGSSLPIGLSTDTPDVGLFLYLSVEPIYRRTD